MESFRGPINSLLSCGGEEVMSSESMLHPHMTFLQMLQVAMQPRRGEEEEEEGGGGEEEQPQSNLQLLLQLQNQQQKIESYVTRPSAKDGKAAEVGPTREKKRKKRPRPSSSACAAKNEQEMESQRRTHIAVERNRRRLMNSHIDVLRSLMPSSFLQRSDQASIIGGAVDFVKELEQLLLSLQSEKRMRAASAAAAATSSSNSDNSTANDDQGYNLPYSSRQPDGFFVSPQYTGYSDILTRRRGGEEAVGVDVEATVVQGHVNLKVAGRRRVGQLVRAIAALEELRLSVLHLNIAPLDSDAIFYSLNLKMEEECKFGSADEIATAVHHIFLYIGACC